MFWPIVLPFQITSIAMLAFVVGATLFAVVCKRKWLKTLGVSTAMACISFIPSCALIATMLDTQRFGLFEYRSFDDINDFRVQRFLPAAARNITAYKRPSGHQAKYIISEEELRAFVDGLWRNCGDRSAISRKELDHDPSSIPNEQAFLFGGLNWPVLDDAIRLRSPVAGNGAGARYFYSRSTQTTYHDAGYW